ncbi:MAG: T9SS type A sorting domain-containing protein [bacterium]|nr:T9SS type A sorting domain-containing protein [bacterium]
MIGLTENGLLLDPCTFAFGEVRGGVGCNLVNPIFWFSGDPVTDIGWICIQKGDLRAAGTAGPFTLVKDQEVEILIGYEIDRGTTPLGGITAVRAVSDAVQVFYENNFGYPIVSVDNEIPMISNFKLEQNYPNPFNPSTNIGFVIASEAKQSQPVTLKVYDVLGNEVATLVNEELSAGEYEVTFDVGASRDLSLSSGIYFYTLRAGEFVQTKKMVLMK